MPGSRSFQTTLIRSCLATLTLNPGFYKSTYNINEAHEYKNCIRRNSCSYILSSTLSVKICCEQKLISTKVNQEMLAETASVDKVLFRQMQYRNTVLAMSGMLNSTLWRFLVVNKILQHLQSIPISRELCYFFQFCSQHNFDFSLDFFRPEYNRVRVISLIY